MVQGVKQLIYFDPSQQNEAVCVGDVLVGVDATSVQEVDFCLVVSNMTNFAEGGG